MGWRDGMSALREVNHHRRNEGLTVRDWTVRAWDCQDYYGDSMQTELVLALGLGLKRASIETRMIMSYTIILPISY